MPQALTVGQREFIQSAISHLVDLSPEEKQLGQEVAQIKQALEEKVLPEEHDYAQLQKCYFNPTAYFHRLEELNPDICVGLVQECILEFISEKIEKSGTLAQKEPSYLEWSLSPYLEKLHHLENAAAFTTPFRSQEMIAEVEDHPWQIPVDTAKIFTAEFIQMRQSRLLQVKITIHMDNWLPLYGETIKYPAHLENDRQEDEFMNARQPFASKKAEQQVIAVLLNHLVGLSLVTPTQKMRASEGAKNLLAYRFYFNAIHKGQINFSELMYIGPHQTQCLVEPAVIGLLKAKKCGLGFAKNLMPAELSVIKNHYYFDELIHSHISLLEIKGVYISQSAILYLPSIIYLQKKGKISFADAKTISPEALPFFKRELCLQLLMENKVSFQDAKRLKAAEVALVTEPFYTAAIFNGRLSISDIKRFSTKEIENLLFPPLLKLLKKNKISLDEAKESTWGFHFGSRLIGLFEGVPYQKEGKSDDINSLKKDLEQTADSDPFYSRKELCHQAIKIFFHYLQQELAHECESLSPIHSNYTHFLNELLLLDNSPEEKNLSPGRDYFLLTHQIMELIKLKIAFFENHPEQRFSKRARITFSLFAMSNTEDIQRIKDLQLKMAPVAFLANLYHTVFEPQVSHFLPSFEKN